jgi:hypothetical protein
MTAAGTLFFEDDVVHYTLWALFDPESYDNRQQENKRIKFAVNMHRQKYVTIFRWSNDVVDSFHSNNEKQNHHV